jgi:LysR family transcriptional regulator for bpeEF and oprC
LHGAPKSIEQLHQHDVIHYTPRRFGPPREFRYVVSGNETRIKLAERISVSDAHAAIRYAIDGVGIAQVCRRMVEEHLEAGRLVSLLDGSEPPALPISVLYSGRGQPSKSIRVFIDWLHDQMNHPRAGSRQIDMPPITGFSASTSSMRQRDSYHPTAVLQNRPPPGELRLASARPAG